MRNTINVFMKSQKQLLKGFGCPSDYFIKPLPESAWQIVGDDDIPILSYEHKNEMLNAIIVRHKGRPMIYRANGFVLVVAIDCVKIAFIFDQNRELNV